MHRKSKIGGNMSLRIKEVMDERKVTSAWLAEQVGISKVAVSNIVTGKNSPSVDNLLKIAEVLNVSITYLLGLSEDKGEKDKSFQCPYCGKPIDVSLLKAESEE